MDRSTSLPWEDLRRVEGELPWTALEAFGDAVVADPDLGEELFAEYDRAWQAVDVPTYVDLYVPAICALAAPRLGEQPRREIGGFLIDRLTQAGKEGADLTEEALSAAAGSLGPVILPKVLDTLESMLETDDFAAWSWCWNLTALAAQIDDVVVRDQTIRLCIRLLEQIERGAYEAFEGISAAWTLALLKYAQAAPLLQRLGEKTDFMDGGADYEEALKFLQGQRTEVYKEAWERPVRDWLESSWETTRKWHAERKAKALEKEQEAAFQRRVQELIDAFRDSRWAADLPPDWAKDVAHIVYVLLEYAHRYEGATPEELTQPVLRAVLQEEFPRRMIGEREYFKRLPAVVEAFLRWMASEGILPDGESLADAVHGWADDIVAAAMNPKNWSPVKRFTMENPLPGMDKRNRGAVYERMFEEAQRGLEELPYELPKETPITPPIPIVEHSPKTGRNDPCPCGSGKKYKKCCGNPAKGQATSV